MGDEKKLKTRETQRVAVLVVDDDEADYVIARDLLQKTEGARYHLDWVSTYDEALKLIEINAHDVYLIDYRLGERSGLELLRELIAQGCKKPVIFLTSADRYEVDLSAMEAGAADYLVKQELTGPLLERAIRYAIKHAEMSAALEELATHDALTGLYNRREMDRLLRDEFSRYRRYGYPFALLMADIDHFKRVNDQYGHQVGDQVLQWIAKHFRESVRPMDWVARYGGEEIAVIAPQTTADEAFEMGERLRQIIAGQPVPVDRDNGQFLQIPITISIGVASLPRHANCKEALISASDQALYEAKREGRNRTVQFRRGASPLEQGLLQQRTGWPMDESPYPITILMAEDDADDRLMAKEAFEEAELADEVRFVVDGEDLLDYLHHRGKYQNPSTSPRPSLILLDLNMPKKNGQEVLEEIKADPDLRRIPIVVLTATREEEDILRTYDLGASSFIVKPVAFDGLVRTMKVLSEYWFQIVQLPPERR